MAYRWWRNPGEVVWSGQAWFATLTNDDGRRWGLALALHLHDAPTSPNAWWAWDTGTLDGAVVQSMPADDIASLSASLEKRSPVDRARLSELETNLLDHACLSVRESARVSGKKLRYWGEQAASDAEVRAALARLTPRLLTHHDWQDRDEYEPTALGLLQSQLRGDVAHLLEGTLGVFTKAFAADPDVRTFAWRDVVETTGLSLKGDQQFASNVYRLFDWSGASREENGVWGWEVPADLEHLRKLATLDGYERYCRDNPEKRGWPTCPEKLPTDEDHRSRVASSMPLIFSQGRRSEAQQQTHASSLPWLARVWKKMTATVAGTVLLVLLGYAFSDGPIAWFEFFKSARSAAPSVPTIGLRIQDGTPLDDALTFDVWADEEYKTFSAWLVNEGDADVRDVRVLVDSSEVLIEPNLRAYQPPADGYKKRAVVADRPILVPGETFPLSISLRCPERDWDRCATDTLHVVFYASAATPAERVVRLGATVKSVAPDK